MLEEVTREYFNKRKEAMHKKWRSKVAQVSKGSKDVYRFYRKNLCEIYKDIEELYDMAITLSIKGE